MSEYPLRIVVRESSIEQISSGSILGVVYWQWKSETFPDSNWDDFIVVILGWWVQNIAKLASRTSDAAEMSFMDGPYKVLCERRGDLLFCQFVERRPEENVLATCSVTIDDLSASMLDAAKTVLVFCQRNGICNADVELLDQEISNLNRILQERT
jgi:hypothetical protein